MPIYEYRCSACGFEKEYLQKLSDAPIHVCESCGRATMSKLVSAAGFQLKGSGWYVTDFKNNGSKPKEAEAGRKEGGKEPAGTEASTSSPSTTSDSGAKTTEKSAAPKSDASAPTSAG
jgi:putative FmdB family regulatory protein